jgi:hypothetical protein
LFHADPARAGGYEPKVRSQFLPSHSVMATDRTVPGSRHRLLTLYPSGCERGT